MKKKIITILLIGLCISLLFPMGSTADETKENNDNVDVKVFAGLFRRNVESNIGFDICIWTLNNKEESVTVEFIFSQVTPRWWEHHNFTYNAPVGEHIVTFGQALVTGFFQMEVIIDDTTVTRRGMIVGGLVILRPIIELPDWRGNIL